MFTIKPYRGIIEYSKYLVENVDFGKNVKGSGNPEQQFTGICIENAIKDALDMPLVEISNKPDGGWDIPINHRKVDIKGQGRKVYPRQDHACNFLKRQVKRTTDYLLFASLNKNNMDVTVCGVIKKDYLLQTALYIPAGSVRTRDDGSGFYCRQAMYEIPINSLIQLNSFDDLFGAVK